MESGIKQAIEKGDRREEGREGKREVNRIGKEKGEVKRRDNPQNYLDYSFNLLWFSSKQ